MVNPIPLDEHLLIEQDGEVVLPREETAISEVANPSSKKRRIKFVIFNEAMVAESESTSYQSASIAAKALKPLLLIESKLNRFVTTMHQAADAHQAAFSDSAYIIKNITDFPSRKGEFFRLRVLDYCLKIFIYNTRFNTFTAMLYTLGYEPVDLPAPGVARYVISESKLELIVTEVEVNVSVELVIPQALFDVESENTGRLDSSAKESDYTIWRESLQAYCCWLFHHLISRWYEYRVENIEIVYEANSSGQSIPNSLVLHTPTLVGSARSRWSIITNPTHRMIAELWDKGYTAKEIGGAVGLTEGTVYNIASMLRHQFEGACPRRGRM